MNPRPTALACLLIVEDDPVSASFLHDAAVTLPATVQLACRVADAEHACTQHRFDLLLIDAHLPDGRGDTLLQRLRHRGICTPALAHTAHADAAACAQLHAAGFLEVLQKPMSMDSLHTALRRHLPTVTAAHPALWNDAEALAAVGGNPAHVSALRGLFLQELPEQHARIHAAIQQADAAAVRAELHKLTASCGFVGAAQLAQAVHALRADPLDTDATHALDIAVQQTLRPR